ncbi:NB-ARC domain-containing protein [Streptomyces globisporus]|uniref:NB-ARC domain-containing protein n=1 Tax=Streptomyces globisporus TaxID=1908 RepID=UPI0036F6FDDE
MGITTSLSGAGGFGKTTLTSAVCAHKRVRRRFRSRTYVVTIGRDVRGHAAVAAKVAEATRFITGDTTEYDDPDLAGAHLGRLLDQRPRTLLVLDDVWEREQLAPFLRGGRRCVRLVTTRNPNLLPSGSRRIHVDHMSPAQAKAVLTWNLPPLPDSTVSALLRVTGRWALLLRLTNRLIAEQCAGGADATATAERILHRLGDTGPAAVDDPNATWNLDDPRQRNQAVKASIEAATTLLPPGGPDRFTELGIFAEDESIPIPLIARLWQASRGLTEDRTRTLCRDLERLSLLTLDPADAGTISLHDVIRDYLRAELGTAGLARTNDLLVQTVAATLPAARPLAPTHPDPERAWWHLTDGYLLDHLIDHLLAADRTPLAEAVAGDLRWIETRLLQRGPTAPFSDLTRIDTPHTRALAHSLAQTAHLLTPTEPAHALTGVLHNRLDTHPHWQPQITAHHHDPVQLPCLATQWPLPDAPAPELQRTLTGHTGPVRSLVIAPDGTWLATASNDGTVRLWDRVSGTCTATLTGHTGPVRKVVMSPDGTWLATNGDDGTVRLWDRVSGTCTATLTGNTGRMMSVVIAPDGTWLATTSHDETVRLWDRVSGTCTATLTGNTGTVWSVAIAPDSTWLATTSRDGTVRLWDRVSGTCTATLTDMVREVVIAPDSTWLAAISIDASVRLWDRASGTCTATLIHHTDMVWSVVVAPDGTWLATTSRDGTVRLWDRVSGARTATLTGHTGPIDSVVMAPDGTWLTNSGDDGTVRLWDRVSGTCTATLTGHTGTVREVVIAPDSTWLATNGDNHTVRLWDRVSGACTATLTGHTGTVREVVIAPDGTWLATTSHDESVRLWDRATGTCTATLTDRIDYSGPVWSVAIAPDGTWLATTSRDGTVRLWDRLSGTCTATLTGHTDTVGSVAIAPDSTWLATTSHDESVRLWDRLSGTCTATLTGHTDTVGSVAIAPDGTWLATTSHDGTVRIQNVNDPGIVAIARAEGPLFSCAWGAAHELAVGGECGLYLYKLLI